MDKKIEVVNNLMIKLTIPILIVVVMILQFKTGAIILTYGKINLLNLD